eukprot:TRINITY_DN7028_c0_g1_i1.p1 TRINITY_DN7028_c0_g1~~TRINITY_DN7028_c0_g1_i1.p1  ORF type:complete len:308 (-),score=44.67 TRINITY_DN7028_c0_g1_i1:15-905(-)
MDTELELEALRAENVALKRRIEELEHEPDSSSEGQPEELEHQPEPDSSSDEDQHEAYWPPFSVHWQNKSTLVTLPKSIPMEDLEDQILQRVLLLWNLPDASLTVPTFAEAQGLWNESTFGSCIAMHQVEHTVIVRSPTIKEREAYLEKWNRIRKAAELLLFAVSVIVVCHILRASVTIGKKPLVHPANSTTPSASTIDSAGSSFSFFDQPDASTVGSSSILASLFMFIVKDFLQKLLDRYFAGDLALDPDLAVPGLTILFTVVAVGLLIFGNCVAVIFSWVFQAVILILSIFAFWK